MAEVDTSSYPKYAPVNPLQQMEGTVGIAGGLANLQGRQQENKLLQMQVQGRQGMQEAYEKSANQDGTINTSKLQQIIMQDPRTSWMAGDIAQQNQALNHPVNVFRNNTPGMMGGQQATQMLSPGAQPGQQPPHPSLDPDKATRMHKQLDTVISTLSPLIANPNTTAADVAKHAAELVGDGEFLSPQAATAEMVKLAKLPQDQIQAELSQYYQKALTNKAQLTQMAPPPPQATPDAQQPEPTAPEQQPASQEAPAQGSSEQDSNFIQTGPKLGVEQYQAGLGTAATGRVAETVQAAKDAPIRMNVMDNILKLSKNTPTGPGQDWQNRLVGHLANSPVVGAALDWTSKNGITPDLKDYSSRLQELKKFMAQNAQRAWQASGGTGTDAQLQAFDAANPNDHMFPQAVQAMAKYVKGLDMMTLAKANAQDKFLKGNDDPDHQQQFESHWRNSVDPRVFQMQSMEPNEQADMVKNMSPDEYKSFKQHRRSLMGMGALEPQGAQ